MKYSVLLICLVTMVSGVWAATQYRDFTDTQGRTIRGCIKAYDATKKSVKFERENKRPADVPISIFSEADQEYIKKWNNQNSIRSTSKFTISCDRRSVKNWTKEQFGTITYSDGSVEHDQVTGKAFFKETAYEIGFANRNSHAVTDLLLEYCIYYEQQVEGSKEAKPGILFGSLPIDKLDKGERREILTDSVVIFKDEKDASFINARVLKGSVIGIAMRLYLKEGDEKILIREMAVPDNVTVKHKWSSKSKPVGLNK